MLVSKGPGARQFTRMPCGASFTARSMVSVHVQEEQAGITVATDRVPYDNSRLGGRANGPRREFGGPGRVEPQHAEPASAPTKHHIHREARRAIATRVDGARLSAHAVAENTLDSATDCEERVVVTAAAAAHGIAMRVGQSIRLRRRAFACASTSRARATARSSSSGGVPCAQRRSRAPRARRRRTVPCSA